MTRLEILSGSDWIDKTGKLTRLNWSTNSRELESLRFSLYGDDVAVGQRVRFSIDEEVSFEGVVYEVERRHEAGDVKRIEVLAYSDLILYDRSIVFREYPAGTRAGSIIKDLASLVQDVDTSNVDEDGTPSLNSVWTVQNIEALKVMLDVARGTNYHLRMRPGKRLYFKPKALATYKAMVDYSNTLSASYREDRWRLRNRVVYVGAGGRVLAEVSEPPGDMPLTVHDPFLTSEEEAYRRAQTRLALCKEYGRQLEVELHKNSFEQMGIGLFDTLRINLPSLGLEYADLLVTGIEYDPAGLRYRLTLGGTLELLEDYLDEYIGGDVAARFGSTPILLQSAEKSGSAYELSQSLSKRFVTQLIPRLFMTAYLPPIPYASGQNITYNDSGEIVLASGFTTGSFTLEFMPQGENVEARRFEYVASAGGGSYTVTLKRGDGSIIKSNVTSPYEFPYIPKRKTLAEKDADKWVITGGTLSDSTISIISRYSLKTVGTTSMTLQYPATGSLGWNLSEMRYFNIYIYPIQDATIEVRVLTNTANYYTSQITVTAGRYSKYVKKLSDFTAVGAPSWNNISQLQLILPAGTYYIDFDHVFTPISYEKIIIDVAMSRQSASNASPIFSRGYLFWSEVTQA